MVSMGKYIILPVLFFTIISVYETIFHVKCSQKNTRDKAFSPLPAKNIPPDSKYERKFWLYRKKSLTLHRFRAIAVKEELLDMLRCNDQTI